jgi:hypothetical protein
MRFQSIRLAFVAITMSFVAPVSATTYDFDLAGQIGNGTTSVFTSGGQSFTIFELGLDGLETPIELAIGDVFNLHITLDEPMIIQSSTGGTFFGIDAITSPSEFSLLDEGTISSGTVSPVDGAYSGQTFFGACSNCIAATASLGAAHAFQVGEFYASITIESLLLLDPGDTSPVILNGFQLRSQSTDLAAAVPGPQTWAMMLAGFGAIGTTMRRKSGSRSVRRTAA